MKYFLHSFYFFIALMITSCEEDIVVVESAEQSQSFDGMFCYPLHFDVPYPHYEEENETRATEAGKWEDGDVIYLFLGGDNEAFANATFNKENNNWVLRSNKMLDKCTTSQCTAWYGKGNGRKTIPPTCNYIDYDYLTEAYFTESGQYSFLDGVIYVSAKLEPYARRLRFKGEPGTEFKVQGKGMLVPYSRVSTDESVGFHLCEKRNWDLIINENGFTDYLVFAADKSTVQITIIDPQSLYTYSRYFDQKTLKTGESGCFTLPSVDKYQGWTRGHEWQYEFVDLGLPSGTLWATCNVGAFSPEEYGFYYAWGETEPKDKYDWGTYKWCNGTYSKLTKYCTKSSEGIVDNKTSLDPEDDAAYINWGEEWHMPTRTQVQELMNNCIWSCAAFGSSKSFKAEGPNGNYIFFPGANYLSSTSASSFSYGYYSTKSLANSPNESIILEIQFYQNYETIEIDQWSRYCGLSVRAVCK